MEEENFKNLGDYLSIAWRRRYYILLPFVLLFIVTVFVVSVLPPIFQSQATVLVESQKISKDLVQSTVTSYAQDRIHLIVKRIMSSNQLLDIASKFEIFADRKAEYRQSERLKDMRERIKIKLVGADGERVRRGSNASIAFTISFEDGSPDIARDVTNELVTLFLNENIRSRTERVEETTEFLSKEAQRLGEQIEQIEGQLAEFKLKNKDSLPETLTVNLQRVTSLRAEYLKTDAELATLEEKRNLLLVDLQALRQKPEVQAAADPEFVALKQELKQLQNNYFTLAARYGAQHPDVKAANRQIVAFKNQHGDLVDKRELLQEKKQVEEELIETSAKYSDEHPDVKRLGRKLEGIDIMLSQFDATESDEPVQVVPAVLQVQTRIEAVDKSINRVKRSRVNLRNQISSLDGQIAQIPEVERGIDALQRDYENTKGKYQEIKEKQLEAELSKSLEEDQKAERFTLIEPPLLPDYPVKPKRLQLLVLGFGLSLFCGIGAAGIAESLDSGIRGSRALASVTKMMPLATIPYITTAQDNKRKIRNIIIFFIVCFIVAGIVLTILHYNYKPLDLLWLQVLDKLNAI